MAVLFYINANTRATKTIASLCVIVFSYAFIATMQCLLCNWSISSLCAATACYRAGSPCIPLTPHTIYYNFKSYEKMRNIYYIVWILSDLALKESDIFTRATVIIAWLCLVVFSCAVNAIKYCFLVNRSISSLFTTTTGYRTCFPCAPLTPNTIYWRCWLQD